jgi:MFS family permease
MDSFFSGIIIVITLYKWQETQKGLERASWQYFILWLVVGNVIALALSSLLSRYIIIDKPNFIYIVFTYCLLLPIVNARADKIIKQIKPRYKYSIQRNQLLLLINWKRFLRGFKVGALYSIASSFIFLVTYNSYNLANLLYLIFERLSDIIGLGLIIGCLYGFGPVLVFKVENLSERRFGQIGIVMALTGIIIAALPH